MTDAILARRPDAIFVNSESSEYCQACCPDPRDRAHCRFENERRFLPARPDLRASRSATRMRGHLRDHGMVTRRSMPGSGAEGSGALDPRRRLLRMERAADRQPGPPARARRTVRLVRDREPILRALPAPDDAYRDQPHGRLGRPALAVAAVAQRPAAAHAGVPLVGFTWYSLTDQVDWDIALSRAIGNVEPGRPVRPQPRPAQRRPDLQEADRDAPRQAGVQILPGAEKVMA